MSEPAVSPWQVWWTSFDPQVGREQAGLRPVVVVGTSFACELPNGLALVIPCTTTDRGLPFHPAISCLAQLSFVMCDQLKSLSRERLVRLHPAAVSADEAAVIQFVLRRLVDVG